MRPGWMVALLISTTTLAQDQADAKPDTAEQAADKVLKALEAKDQEALKRLAEKDNPDPWLTADELCARGEHEAAAAFAGAALRRDTEKLPDYVASRKGAPPQRAARDAVADAKRLIDERKPAEALHCLEGLDADGADVLSLVIASKRARALEDLRRLRESVALFASVGQRAQQLGWRAREAAAANGRGTCALWAGDPRRAVEHWRHALALREDSTDRALRAALQINIGIALDQMGRGLEAIASFERGLEDARAARHPRWIGNALNNLATTHADRGDLDAALKYARESLVHEQEHGDAACLGDALNLLGIVRLRRSEMDEALRGFRAAFEKFVEAGDELRQAYARMNMANVFEARGEARRALAEYEHSLDVYERHRRFYHAANVRLTVGRTLVQLGSYTRALRLLERAHGEFKQMEYHQGRMQALAELGKVWAGLGQPEKARDFFEEGHALAAQAGHRTGRIIMGTYLAGLHRTLGDLEQARRFSEEVLRLAGETSPPEILATLGWIHEAEGDYGKALDLERRALEIYRERQDRGALSLPIEIARLLTKTGRAAEARDLYEQALADAEKVGRELAALRALRGLASLHLGAHRYTEAIERGRAAADKAARLFHALGDEDSVQARESWETVYRIGVAAALGSQSTRDACYFLESGRAAVLLESLRDRTAIQDVAIPANLRHAEEEARDDEQLALWRLRRAVKKGARAEIRKRRQALDDARKRTKEVVARIQREQKAVADVVYPRAASLEVIQKTLRPREALVLYSLLKEDTIALVVTPDAARLVQAGARGDVEAAVRALGARDRTTGASGIEELRELIWDPLGLGKDVRRVLVSPAGTLAYVPFVLLAGKREVAYVPSGTTFGVLLAEPKKRGKNVLAIGDPDYETSGRKLAPLPATRPEVNAVGDVVLVGQRASETRFRSEARSTRWRAVHLACHGLIDPEHPMFSSLALSPDKEQDGFLTTLDLFRLEVPADLVVLSACETAKGKVFKAEGMVGFTRAFMVAGAPRVIASLWKVDDEATRTLMVKFYELWNPKDGKEGLPTATALKQAQEFVRDHPDHPQWKHPYYWAAWQLWGLPD